MPGRPGVLFAVTKEETQHPCLTLPVDTHSPGDAAVAYLFRKQNAIPTPNVQIPSTNHKHPANPPVQNKQMLKPSHNPSPARLQPSFSSLDCSRLVTLLRIDLAGILVLYHEMPRALVRTKDTRVCTLPPPRANCLLSVLSPVLDYFLVKADSAET